jgi:hypothetical protein
VDSEFEAAFESVTMRLGGFTTTFGYFLIVGLALILVRMLSFIIGSLLSSYKIFKRLNQCTIDSNMSFFDSCNTGKIIARVGQDISFIDDIIPLYWYIVLE